MASWYEIWGISSNTPIRVDLILVEALTAIYSVCARHGLGGIFSKLGKPSYPVSSSSAKISGFEGHLLASLTNVPPGRENFISLNTSINFNQNLEQ